jgi:molybdenum cofactor cytidylyltransferase
MRLAILLLAAGRSLRFGTANKLLTPYHGRPLVDHAASLACSLGAQHLFASLSDTQVAARLPGFETVWVNDPAQGQAASLALGIAAIAHTDADAALVLLGDMPNVTPDHARRVAELGQSFGLAASCMGEHRMPPACFARHHFASLLRLTGDRGARALLDSIHPGALVSAPASVLGDIDTPDDLASVTRDHAE